MEGFEEEAPSLVRSTGGFYIGFGPDRGIRWDIIEPYLLPDELELRDAMRAEPLKFWHSQHATTLLLERLANVRRIAEALRLEVVVDP